MSDHWEGDPGPDDGADWWHQIELESRRYIEELEARHVLPTTTKETTDEIPRQTLD